MSDCDLLIVGAGPAGMTAAITARHHGLDVLVVDDQPAPGGQIWRSVEMARARDEILGPSYSEGRAVAEVFRTCGARYEPGAKLWQVEPGYRAFYSLGETPRVVEAGSIILATGAQERPVPFPGWTLPGVLTVGAAQILLKNAGQIPANPVWIAGSGPLPLLYAIQLLRAGGQIAGYLDTTPSGRWRSAIRHLPGAIPAFGEILKGLDWIKALRRSGTRYVKDVAEIEAVGEERIETLHYRTADGHSFSAPANVLLVHEGVVPHIHAPMSLGCTMEWTGAQDCLAPTVDEWGETSLNGVFVAGDGAGIGGAKAATLRGKLAALRVAERSGRIGARDAVSAARSVRRALARELAVRPFLDALFRPRPQVFAPPDETIVCRCEEVTAGDVRKMAMVGRPGPNQMKAATRAGMGPCQGRQCGYTIARLIAATQDRSPADVGFFNVRPPLKPITVGELAALDGIAAR